MRAVVLAGVPFHYEYAPRLFALTRMRIVPSPTAVAVAGDATYVPYPYRIRGGVAEYVGGGSPVDVELDLAGLAALAAALAERPLEARELVYSLQPDRLPVRLNLRRGRLEIIGRGALGTPLLVLEAAGASTIDFEVVIGWPLQRFQLPPSGVEAGLRGVWNLYSMDDVYVDWVLDLLREARRSFTGLLASQAPGRLRRVPRYRLIEGYPVSGHGIYHFPAAGGGKSYVIRDELGFAGVYIPAETVDEATLGMARVGEEVAGVGTPRLGVYRIPLVPGSYTIEVVEDPADAAAQLIEQMLLGPGEDRVMFFKAGPVVLEAFRGKPSARGFRVQASEHHPYIEVYGAREISIRGPPGKAAQILREVGRVLQAIMEEAAGD